MKFLLNPQFYLPILYIVGGVLLYIILKIVIKKALGIKIGRIDINDRREKTIVGLITNISKYVISFVVIILVLNTYGVNTTALLAGLGIVGLVIGLGVQDTIKDFLSGFFIIFDNQYAIGDTVEIKGFIGEVIQLGLKSTKLRSESGKIKTIANRNIGEIVNYSIYPATIKINITTENTENLEEIFVDISKDLEKKLEKIVSEVKQEGITNMKDKPIYTLSFKTKYKNKKTIEKDIYIELPRLFKKYKLNFKSIEVIYE